jgi:hypothetical protein
MQIKNNILKTIFTISIVFAFFSLNAQYLSKAQKEELIEKQKDYVEIFTDDEQNNFDRWFTEEVNKMNLSKIKYDEYYRIIFSYSFKMNRLNDKDIDYTKEMINRDFEILLKTQDGKIKALLSVEEYKMHQKFYGKLIKSVKKRLEKVNAEHKN